MRHRARSHSAAPYGPRSRRIAAVAGLSALTVFAAGTLAWTSASAAPTASEPLPTLTMPALPAPLPTLTVAPAPKPKPSATKAKPAKRLTLAELHAEVKRIDADLEERTRRVEESDAALVAAQKRLVVVRAEATAARAEATRAHVDLGKFAAAAYRGQQVSPVVTVLMGPPAGATDTLRNLQNLEQSSEIKTDITTYAKQTADRAAQLEQEAAMLTASNAATAYLLTAARDEVRVLAQTTQTQLVAEMKRLAEERARAAAKDCMKKAAIAAEFPNGLIPATALCSTGIGSFMLRGDAAVAFKKLAVAYKKEFDEPICLNSAYRDRALQATLYAADTVMVALPGRSHHGLGLATDLCGGIERFGSPQHEWMKENAGKYGFFHPDWAQPGGVTPEPWHWEFKVATYPSNDGTSPSADDAPDSQ